MAKNNGTTIESPLVSIIIPVYKVEPYLEKCVRSVMEQSYRNLEIILVDDGSPDNCPALCDGLANKDRRISVIHKENGGLSDARNCGMQASKGTYIYFLDSDDYIMPDAIKKMMMVMLEANADIVCADYCSVTEDGRYIDHGHQNLRSDFSAGQAIDYFSTRDWGAWGKLYKRSIHQNIHFPVGRIHEDEAIMFQLISRCNLIAVLPDVLYSYLKRNESITAQTYTKKKMDWFYGWKNNVEFISERYPQQVKKCLSKAWDVSIYNIDYLCLIPDSKKELAEIKNFANKYKLKILCNRSILLSKRIRLILFLLSNMNKEKNIYFLFYNMIGRL